MTTSTTLPRALAVGYNAFMHAVVKKFSSHAAAAASDRTYYRALTPEQRLDILLEIIASQRSDDEASQRLACVCRITQRGKR